MEQLVGVLQSLKKGINWKLVWIRNSCWSVWMERIFFTGAVLVPWFRSVPKAILVTTAPWAEGGTARGTASQEGSRVGINPQGRSNRQREQPRVSRG